MAFLVCLLFRESIGVAITKSFVIFVRKFFVSSIYIEIKKIHSKLVYVGLAHARPNYSDRAKYFG